jgi:hypothetical protein
LLEVLSRLLADWLAPRERLLASRVAVRHFFPGKRCSAELELAVGPTASGVAGRRRVLAKFYGDDQGARIYETLRELRGHGLDVGPFIVPRVLAYDSDHRLLLLDWAEGESLESQLLASPDAEDGAAAIARAADWLLSLHRCGVTSGRLYTVNRHVETVTGWMRLLAEVLPEGERLLADLAVALRQRGLAVSRWTAGPVHRDFSPEHLVVTGAGLMGLDFDEFCQYDPLFDVAHFTVHLRFLGLRRFGALHRLDRLADRFVARYKAGGGEDSDQRRRLYEAMTYVKLGRFVALIRQAPGWRQIVPALLTEARRLVDGYGT